MSAESERRFTRYPRGPIVATVLFAALLCLVVFNVTSSFQTYELATIFVFGIAALGQDWLIGSAGQVSLGGAAFMAVGAFTVAATEGTFLGSWPLQIIAGGVFGAVCGALVGLTAFRLNGIYLLLSTLAFQFIVGFVSNEYQGNRVAGFIISAPKIGGWSIASTRGLTVFTGLGLAVVAAFSYSMRRRAPGRYWKAIREGDVAAASIGVDVRRWKLLAFVGSSVVTSIAGVMYAWVSLVVSSSTFSLTIALSIAVMVFLGGRDTIVGPLVGAAAVTLLPQGLNTLATQLPTTSSWITLNSSTIVQGIYGLVLLLVVLLVPGGLAELAIKTARATHRGYSSRLGKSRKRVIQEAPAGRIAVAQPATASGESEAGVILRVAGMTVRYPNGAMGVDGVSLAVRQGSILAVIGRNGAGKTSLLRGLAGFPAAERVAVSGQVTVAGANRSRTDPRAMRELGLGWVPERDKVFPGLTVLEHLELTGVKPPRIAELLDSVPALARLRDRPAGYLSGGERQLLALTAAIAPGPRVLLIDEPSLGLSPIATRDLMQTLVRLRREQSLTVVMSEQVIETIGTVADRFVVMDGGRITMEGGIEMLDRDDVRTAVMGHR